ncbi:hypothetical protein BDV59DRAFT_202854 [Aspergillus ambiguus]|uniref:uncharacterized protein n=1 Tax=Aspergillus ambiguus TaxID=176160 RepID=UPI003CCDEDBA
MKFNTVSKAFTVAVTLGLAGAADPRLANRTNTGVEYVEGPFVPFQPGFLGGTWELFYNTNWVTLTGTGYVRLRWEFEYWKRAGPSEDITMNATNVWKLVAGGGTWRMADSPASYCNDPSGVCVNNTGGSDYGYTWFTNGANHWHDEYFWLDGNITLQTNEGTGLYNVAAQPSDYEAILDDVLNLGGEFYDPPGSPVTSTPAVATSTPVSSTTSNSAAAYHGRRTDYHRHRVDRGTPN